MAEEEPVVPRPVPIFLHDVATSPVKRQAELIQSFQATLGNVFESSKVTDEDACDLLVALLSAFQLQTSMEEEQVGNRRTSLAFVCLRLLVALFDVREAHSYISFAALKRIQQRVIMQQTKREAHELLEGDTSQEQPKNANDTLDALSPVRSPETEAAEGTDPQLVSTLVIHCVTAVNLAGSLYMDRLLEVDSLRAMTLQLWRWWDSGMVDISYFMERKEIQHVYFPNRMTSDTKVYRDFVTCTKRPKLTKEWGSGSMVHIKTNIPAKSEVMYRILVEGYNYGVNTALMSDVVGYTNRRWDELGNMTKYGWPEGWDAETTNDYTPGCKISQYFSSDNYVTIRLKAKSFFCVGFSVSAWLVFHGMGNGFPISATIHHQDEDL